MTSSSRRRRPGRPSSAIFGTLAATCSASGRAVGWSDGEWAGAPHLTEAARGLVAEGAVLPVPGTGGYVEADRGDALSAFGVIAHVTRGGTVTGDVPVSEIAELRVLALLEPDDLWDAIAALPTPRAGASDV